MYILSKDNINGTQNKRPVLLICPRICPHKNIVKCLNNVTWVNQYGFIPIRSAVINLASFGQLVSEVLNCQDQACVIVYTDLQKAFDRIDHYFHLTKLECFGFLIH